MVQEEGEHSSGGTINDKLDRLIDDIEVMKESGGKSKDKKFNFRKSKGKLKKNYVMVVYVHTNKHTEIKYLQIKDNSIFIKEKGVYHPVMSDYIFWHKNYPMVIIHEDQLMPVHPDTLFGKGSENDISVRGQKVLFALCKEAQIKPEKKPMNFGVVLIIIIVIAVAVGGYYLFKKK